jgi:hypothetical protein
MAEGKLIKMLRQALDNSDAVVFENNQAPILGSRNVVPINIPCARGNSKLFAIGLEGAITMAGVAVTMTVGYTMTNMFQQIYFRRDGKLLVNSSDASALRELVNCTWDKAPVDTALAAAGTGRTTLLVPASGRAGQTMTVEIDFASEADLFTAGTFTSSTLYVVGYYSPIEIPDFYIETATQTYSGTGMQNLDLWRGEATERGYLNFITAIGDGAVVVDDLSFTDADGRTMMDVKSPQAARFQAIPYTATLATYTLFNTGIDSFLPMSSRDHLMLDIKTAGVVIWAAYFAMESVAINAPNKATSAPSANLNNPVEQKLAGRGIVGRIDSKPTLLGRMFGS